MIIFYPIKLFIIALTFLTRIPVFVKLKINENDLSRSTLFFPLIGGFIAAVLFSLTFLLFKIRLPNIIIVILVTSLEIIITGAFHWDGLADTFDGFFSTHKNKDEMLKIMKDSRIGVMGTLSIICCYAIQIFAMYYLLSNNIIWLFRLLTIFTISKWPPLLLMWLFNKSGAQKKDGLGSVYLEKVNFWFLVISFFYLCPLFYFFKESIIAFAVILVFTLVWYIYCYKKVGKITGDILGATSILSQNIIVLILLVLKNNNIYF